MRDKTPQDYANELMRMYRENENAIKELKKPIAIPVVQSNLSELNFPDGTGGIQVNVTTIGRLYPVKNAMVTIFSGGRDNMTILDSDMTDESGKSRVFRLKTPPASDSQQSDNGGEKPYATYNISVKSDGYVEKIAMNVPVFSGVVSVQGIDMLSISAAGGRTSPQIIDESNQYNL